MYNKDSLQYHGIEIIEFRNLCVENNNEYCCSHNRTDCCSTNKTDMYIVFGCIAGIIIIITYYWYFIKKSRDKIEPVKDVNKVESLDRYKMAVNL